MNQISMSPNNACVAKAGKQLRDDVDGEARIPNLSHTSSMLVLHFREYMREIACIPTNLHLSPLSSTDKSES